MVSSLFSQHSPRSSSSSSSQAVYVSNVLEEWLWREALRGGGIFHFCTFRIWFAVTGFSNIPSSSLKCCVCSLPTLQRLEESDRRAQHTVEQLQREQRHLRRRLEQLGVERTRMDSTGSTLSSDKSDSDQGEPSHRIHRHALEPAIFFLEKRLLNMCNKSVFWIWLFQLFL